MFANILTIVQVSYAANRPDIGWWLVGALLNAAHELRATLPMAAPTWDADYDTLVAEYRSFAAPPAAPRAVLLASQAAALLEQAVRTKGNIGQQYATAFRQWVAGVVERTAPALDVRTLRKKPEGVPLWAWAAGSAVALGAVRYLFGKPSTQECITVIQLEGDDT